MLGSNWHKQNCTYICKLYLLTLQYIRSDSHKNLYEMKSWITHANNFSQIIKNNLILDMHLLPQSLTHNRYIKLCQMKEKEIKTEILNHLGMNRNGTKTNLGGIIKSRSKETSEKVSGLASIPTTSWLVIAENQNIHWRISFILLT